MVAMAEATVEPSVHQPSVHLRFFIAGQGEVPWEVMARKLDRRQAAMYGSNAWVLLAKMDLSDLREVALFLV